MKLILILSCLALSVRAQLNFPASQVFNVAGEYDQSYYSTNINLAALIGSAGSNYWVFSQTQQANETIWEMDVLPVSDGGHGADFAGATFAQRSLGGPFPETAWEYYSLDPTNGLVLYGTYSATGEGSSANQPITPPASVLPVVVHYGDSWNIAYSFTVVDSFFGSVPVDYTATCTVDAYGLAALPGFGVVPVLRITQAEDYAEVIFGMEFPQLDTNWIWVAEGIGYAAQATAYAPDTYSLSAESYTNSFSRVFQNSPLRIVPAAQIVVQTNAVVLTWNRVDKSSGYAIQTCTNLMNSAPWVPVAQLTNLSFSLPVTSVSGAQFYKITALP